MFVLVILWCAVQTEILCSLLALFFYVILTRSTVGHILCQLIIHCNGFTGSAMTWALKEVGR